MNRFSPGIAGPIELGRRIASLDIIRGFALMGILLVNIRSFAGISIAGPGEAIPDHYVDWFIRLFIRGKFFSLFAIMFGYGFALQIRRFEERGLSARLYVRRMVILFIFGALHLLLDPAEVLNLYAICGFLLLLFRSLPSRWILMVIPVLMAAPYLHNAVVTASDMAKDQTEAPVSSTDDQAAEGVDNETMAVAEDDEITTWDIYSSETAAAVYSEKGFADVVRMNYRYSLNRRVSSWVNWLWMLIPLPLMLTGYLIGRHRLMADTSRHRSFFRWVCWLGLGIGLSGTWFSHILFQWAMAGGWNPWINLAGSLLWTVAGLSMALGYAAGIILLFDFPFWRYLLSPLKTYGRLALTNYILQTVICTTIFYAYGFSLFGKLGGAVLMLLAMGILAVQVLFSLLWVRHFNRGPLEWLWRTLTYGRFPKQ